MSQPIVHPKKCISMYLINLTFLNILNQAEKKGINVFTKRKFTEARDEFKKIGLALYGTAALRRPDFKDPAVRRMGFQLANHALTLSDAAADAVAAAEGHPFLPYLARWQRNATTTVIDFFPGFELPAGETPDEFWAKAKLLRETVLKEIGWQDDA